MRYPDIDPIALSLFGQVNIHWYAVSYLLAFFLCWQILKATRGNGDPIWTDQHISDLLSVGMLGVILGGRIGYVLFYGFESFLNNPLILFKIWQGGMSFHGGMLGVIVGLWVYAKQTRRPFFAVTDFVVLGVPLGLACGRIGNFINAELPGRITEVPWGLIYPGDFVTRHPSSLYQMLAEGPLLLGFVWLVSRRTSRVGALSGAFLLGYGCLRFCTEFFRLPDAHMGFMAFGWMTQGQILCIPMILFGLYLMLIRRPT